MQVVPATVIAFVVSEVIAPEIVTVTAAEESPVPLLLGVIVPDDQTIEAFAPVPVGGASFVVTCT